MKMDGQDEKKLQMPIYRFLVIGRMGDGKSSLCRFLTGEQKIQVSSKIQSCTHQCGLFKSSDKLNEERGYAIEVLDSPGLDSREENMLKIVMELADIFSKCEYINGILYAVSMSHNRDQTISWFLNFLRLYFTKEQLAQAIIPILTHYDKIIFEDDEKVMELKNSRKEAIVRIMDEGEEGKQIINFWDNHIEWINDANQKAKLKDIPDFKIIYNQQLYRLIQKAKTIKLQLASNAATFETNLLERMMKEIKKKQQEFKMEMQVIPSIKFKVTINDVKFMKALKEMKSIFSKVFLGIFVFVGARGYAYRKYKAYEKSQQKIQIGLFEQVQGGIDKLMAAGLSIEFMNWLSISTSSKNTVEDLNRVFSCGGHCHIHVNIPENSIYQIDEISLKRISPDSKEQCVLEQFSEKKKGAIFEDMRRFTNEQERQYQFKNVRILRPSNQFLESILKRIVQQKE